MYWRERSDYLTNSGSHWIMYCFFLWLRHNRWKQLDAELSRPIFDKEQLKHNLEDATWYRILEPSLIACVTTYNVVHHPAMIDDRVLEALDFSSKINLNTFNQLYAYIHEHFLAGKQPQLQETSKDFKVM